MKRYLIFGGSNYYPSGGWDDFCCGVDDLAEATCPKDRFGDDCDWWHVVDLQTGEKVKGYGEEK